MAFSYSNSCTIHIPSYVKHKVQRQQHNSHSAPQWQAPTETAVRLIYLHPTQSTVTVTQLSLSTSMAFSLSNRCIVCMLSYTPYNMQWQWHNSHSATQWHSPTATAVQFVQFICFPTTNTTCNDSDTTLTQPLNGILLQQQLYSLYSLCAFLQQIQHTMTVTQPSLSPSMAFF